MTSAAPRAAPVRYLYAPWLLVAQNIVAALFMAFHAPWHFGALTYCFGNGFWIVLADRARRSRGDDARDALISAWVPCLVMTVGGLAMAAAGEPSGAVNHGQAWDGRQYAALHSYFSSGAYVPIEPEFPYTQRVALPYLAAQLRLPAADAFLLLHSVFWAVTIVLFAISCRACFGVRTASIQFGVLWLQLLWMSVPRSGAAYPFTVDSAAVFFLQAWVLLLLSQRLRWLMLLCAGIGVFFKETMLLIVLLSIGALAALWAVPYFRRKLPEDLRELRAGAVAPLLAAVIAAVIGKVIASHVLPDGPLTHGSEWGTIRAWSSRRYHDPLAMLRYAAATFSVYGGFALLRAAIVGKPQWSPRAWAATFAAALVPLYFGACYVAGSDLTRFAFLAFPFVLPLLLAALDEVSLDFGVIALLLGLPSAHAFTPIAAPFRLVPTQDLKGLYSWVMEYAHPAVLGSWIAWWLGSILVLRMIAFSSVWKPKV